jgi:hypothetical protein
VLDKDLEHISLYFFLSNINMTSINGHVNGLSCRMNDVFPEAHAPLAEADPELYGIIKDEEKRQW